MPIVSEFIQRILTISPEAIVDAIFKNITMLILLCVTILLWCFLDRIVDSITNHFFRIAEERTKQSMDGKDAVRRDMLLYRMATLRQLTTQLARGMLGGVMCFSLLSTIGINLKPILAGIGIAGLGISLAAQSIIKDIINGVLILVEDQYNVNDWIRIGNDEGTVELFTLRLTKLRATDGSLITIPNSTIQTVINYTKDWSNTVIYVTIPYEADYQKAKEIMLGLAEETISAGDPQIFQQYTFSGITDYLPDGVKFRCVIKTAPGYQWKVGYKFREELRARYEKAGIRFAYPAVNNYITPSSFRGGSNAARRSQADE